MKKLFVLLFCFCVISLSFGEVKGFIFSKIAVTSDGKYLIEGIENKGKLTSNLVIRNISSGKIEKTLSTEKGKDFYFCIINNRLFSCGKYSDKEEYQLKQWNLLNAKEELLCFKGQLSFSLPKKWFSYLRAYLFDNDNILMEVNHYLIYINPDKSQVLSKIKLDNWDYEMINDNEYDKIICYGNDDMIKLFSLSKNQFIHNKIIRGIQGYKKTKRKTSKFYRKYQKRTKYKNVKIKLKDIKPLVDGTFLIYEKNKVQHCIPNNKKNRTFKKNEELPSVLSDKLYQPSYVLFRNLAVA